jgi:hypothetical protein
MKNEEAISLIYNYFALSIHTIQISSSYLRRGDLVLQDREETPLQR